MKTEKILLYILLFLVAVTLIVVVVKVFFGEPDCDPNRAGYDMKGNKTNKCIVAVPNKTEPTPQGAPASTWVAEVFPLNIGMYGIKTKVLQQVLGITSDGRFGNETKGAVIAKGFSVPLTEVDYNKILATKPSTSSATVSNICSKVVSINNKLLLKKGITNSAEVCALQKLLKINQSGNFDDATELALNNKTGKITITYYDAEECIYGGNC